MKITIHRNALKAVSRFAAKDDFRHYLNGVKVESNPIQTRLIATNGHVLAVHRADAKEENEGVWDGVIPIDAVNTLLKMKTNMRTLKNEPITLTGQDTGEIRADWNGQSIIFRPIDGTFPDYKRIIPRTVSDAASWYDLKYLQIIADAADDLGMKNGYTFRFNGDSAGLASIGADMVAVVMPMRGIVICAGTSGTEWAYADLPEVKQETAVTE